MATIGDLITEALQELGVVEAGGTPTGNDSALGLRKINDLVDQWAAERLLIYTVGSTSFAIAASDATYTVGSGGNINTAWPVEIDHVTYKDTSLSTPVEVELTKLTPDAWAKMPIKGLTSAYPQAFYFDRAFTSSLGTLNLWPVPTSSTLTGYLYAPTPVSEFSALTTSVTLPPGYRRLIVKSLVCELAPAFGRSGSVQLSQQQADEAKRVVKAANTPLLDLSIDSGALPGNRPYYSIWSDQ